MKADEHGSGLTAVRRHGQIDVGLWLAGREVDRRRNRRWRHGGGSSLGSDSCFCFFNSIFISGLVFLLFLVPSLLLPIFLFHASSLSLRCFFPFHFC